MFECTVIREWAYLEEIRRYSLLDWCGLVGGRVPWGGFWVLKAQASHSVSFFPAAFNLVVRILNLSSTLFACVLPSSLLR